MSGLNKKEKRNLNSMIEEIKGNPSSIKAEEYRKEIFFGPKKIAKIRYWFDRAPNIILTDEELNVVKKKYKNWAIIKTILSHQKQLSGDEVIEFYELVNTQERHMLYASILHNDNVDDDYKLEIANKMMRLPNINYQKDFLTLLDINLSTFEPQKVWQNILKNTIDFINNGEKNSQNLVEFWQANTEILDYVCDDLGLRSTKLYDETGNEAYLPDEVKNIFLF